MSAPNPKETNHLKSVCEPRVHVLDSIPYQACLSAREYSPTPGGKRTTKSGGKPTNRSSVRKIARGALPAALLCIGLACSVPDLVVASTLPSKAQAQSTSSKAVQPQVDKQASDAAAQKRKTLIADATAAIAETEQALKALEEKQTDVALKALADATGKLELIIARDPKLALAPVHVDIVTHDLFADPATVGAVTLEARKDLDKLRGRLAAH